MEFSFVPNTLHIKRDIMVINFGMPATNGLFFMSLSDLPGISCADPPLISLPVRLLYSTQNPANE